MLPHTIETNFGVFTRDRKEKEIEMWGLYFHVLGIGPGPIPYADLGIL
jgi:hypothetical protein